MALCWSNLRYMAWVFQIHVGSAKMWTKIVRSHRAGWGWLCREIWFERNNPPLRFRSQCQTFKLFNGKAGLESTSTFSIWASWSYGRILHRCVSGFQPKTILQPVYSGKPARPQIGFGFRAYDQILYHISCMCFAAWSFVSYYTNHLQPSSLFPVGLSPQYKQEFASMSIYCRTAQGSVVGPFKFTKTHWDYYCTSHCIHLSYWRILPWCGWFGCFPLSAFFGPDRLGASNTKPWARWAGRLARQKRSWKT